MNWAVSFSISLKESQLPTQASGRQELALGLEVQVRRSLPVSGTIHREIHHLQLAKTVRLGVDKSHTPGELPMRMKFVKTTTPVTIVGY